MVISTDKQFLTNFQKSTSSETNGAITLYSDQLLHTWKVGETVQLWFLFQKLWVCKTVKTWDLKLKIRYVELYQTSIYPCLETAYTYANSGKHNQQQRDSDKLSHLSAANS